MTSKSRHNVYLSAQTWAYLNRNQAASSEITRLVEAEMNENEITLCMADDAFLGDDAAAIEKIDIDASKAEFEKMVALRIKKHYPELTVSIDWHASRGDFGDLSLDDQDFINEIVQLVYSSQDFWVEK